MDTATTGELKNIDTLMANEAWLSVMASCACNKLLSLKMSTKYTFSDSNLLHFVTFSVVDWIDVFTRVIYKDILIDSIRFCQKNKGLELYGCLPD